MKGFVSFLAAATLMGCGGSVDESSPFKGRWIGVTLEPERHEVSILVYESGDFDGMRDGIPCPGKIAKVSGQWVISFRTGHSSTFDHDTDLDIIVGPGINVARVRGTQ